MLSPPTVGDPFPELALPVALESLFESADEDDDDPKWLLVLYWGPEGGPPEGLGELCRHRVVLSRRVHLLGVTSTGVERSDPFPIVADPDLQLARTLGLPWRRGLRATYLVDPTGVIRWASLEDSTAPRPLGAALAALDATPGIAPSARRLECMCAWCRQVQVGDGAWEAVEAFVEARLPVEFSHGICPSCLQEQTPAILPSARGAEARRSERVLLVVPVLLESNGMSHAAKTVVVNRHGALVLSPASYPEQSEVVVTHLETRQRVRCRVAWCGGPDGQGRHKIGLELLEERPELWGPEYELRCLEQ
jgi:hypothetical protein